MRGVRVVRGGEGGEVGEGHRLERDEESRPSQLSSAASSGFGNCNDSVIAVFAEEWTSVVVGGQATYSQ